MREYAEYKNLEITGEYCDAGKSIVGRPSFMKMLEDYEVNLICGKGEEKPFTYDFIVNVLDNPIYHGKLNYNRRTNLKGVKKK